MQVCISYQEPLKTTQLKTNAAPEFTVDFIEL